jgi:hypothetical protein
MAKVVTVFITAKCSDSCHIKFHDEKNNEIGERNDYVPKWMSEEHYGDYVELEIEIATGKILNWKVPTQKELKDSMV